MVSRTLTLRRVSTLMDIFRNNRIKKEVQAGPNKTPFLGNGAKTYLINQGVHLIQEDPHSFVIFLSGAPTLKKPALSKWWEIIYQTREVFYIQETTQV